MGYRSDVHIMVASTPETIDAVVAMAKLSPNPHRNEMLLTAVRYVDGACAILYWHFDDVKWYDSYEDVQCMMKFFRELPELIGTNAHGQLLARGQYTRIGEGEGDVETEAWGDVDDGPTMYVRTYVSCDLPDNGIPIDQEL